MNENIYTMNFDDFKRNAILNLSVVKQRLKTNAKSAIKTLGLPESYARFMSFGNMPSIESARHIHLAVNDWKEKGGEYHKV